jgi:predicted N-acyltransferase
MSSAPTAHFLAGIGAIGAQPWNALAGDEPFLRHEFLAALETTGCAAAATGWSPHHLVLGDLAAPKLVAPLYEKSHSWGEFVFDFAWARAFEARGIAYYPKLLLAVPFTPATGPRLLCAPGAEADALRQQALAVLLREAAARGRSTAHALFIDEPMRAAAVEAGWLLRQDCHFQWRQRGYRDFEDFLAGFSSEKRKKARRERRRIAEQGIHFEFRAAHTLGLQLLARVYALHADTFRRHGHQPYLTPEAFAQLAATMGDAMQVALARQEHEVVAMAVFFRSRDTLYGRYWGAAGDHHSLHFETCYYQGIEYCLRAGLSRFEPGTQGEHKLARGFEPAITWSAHWIADRTLRRAIADYLQREAVAIADYAASAALHTPFRAEVFAAAPAEVPPAQLSPPAVPQPEHKA